MPGDYLERSIIAVTKAGAVVGQGRFLQPGACVSIGKRNLMISLYFLVAVILIQVFATDAAALQLVAVPLTIILTHAFNRSAKARLINISLGVLIILIP